MATLARVTAALLLAVVLAGCAGVTRTALVAWQPRDDAPCDACVRWSTWHDEPLCTIYTARTGVDTTTLGRLTRECLTGSGP